MREARQAKPPLQLQVAHPPDWLPEAHTSADLGTSRAIILRNYWIRGPSEKQFHIYISRLGHMSWQLSENT